MIQALATGHLMPGHLVLQPKEASWELDQLNLRLHSWASATIVLVPGPRYKNRTLPRRNRDFATRTQRKTELAARKEPYLRDDRGRARACQLRCQ